jgi:DNA-directed RNA polymerase specialized sigma24 family protein
MNQTQYDKYKKIILKICKNDERAEDLLQDVLLQLSSNIKYNALSEKERVFFFIRTVQNQYYSNNSSFQRTYRKYVFEQLPVNYDPKTEEYKEIPTIEWIEETLDTELKDNPERWYEVGIFRLYLQHRKLEPIHRQTKIPKYSLRQTLKEMKEWIKIKWIEYERKD